MEKHRLELYSTNEGIGGAQLNYLLHTMDGKLVVCFLVQDIKRVTAYNDGWISYGTGGDDCTIRMTPFNGQEIWDVVSGRSSSLEKEVP